MAKIAHVSPLAPERFPDLPVIDGVRFATVEAGVRYQGRRDVMLAEIAPGSAMAGVFTRSATRSAPVLWCERHIGKSDPAKGLAILVNSGNSNAFTGRSGEEAVSQLAETVAQTLDIPAGNVFMSSTGVIGEKLPADRIAAKIGALKDALSPDKAEEAARAIMTTDTYAKGAATEVSLGGAHVKIAGFAKGSGMIAPDMATMLVYLFTDAAISQEVLQGAVSRINERSFNCITVDGDTSTSDTLLLAATGKADMDPIRDAGDPRMEAFEAALGQVMLDLAHQVVRDGEGATKFVTVRVEGAASDVSAKIVAMSIANSPLVKTALAGEDPNWGRVVMAVGKAGEPADRDKLSIWFGPTLVADKGWVSPDYREEVGAAYMKNAEIVVTADLGVGDGKATVWTCDLTHTYISINADYRS